MENEIENLADTVHQNRQKYTLPSLKFVDRANRDGAIVNRILSSIGGLKV